MGVGHFKQCRSERRCEVNCLFRFLEANGLRCVAKTRRRTTLKFYKVLIFWYFSIKGKVHKNIKIPMFFLADIR